ncbi:hypothetical protein MES4922_160140 [Mesorhizobium ventifaucium]|uniref:Uncharacterized protein n=1 Tax=Mesorhizobium ventifaucium TaxID=666020 RepID=A0ABN8JER5_9HYPH|nr:hypothetical protein MES4922_160140 [Mesorhizobium ventifaucium]
MPLDIRDKVVDALATKLQREINVASKTEAVRIALLHDLSVTTPASLCVTGLRCCRRSVPRWGHPIPTST